MGGPRGLWWGGWGLVEGLWVGWLGAGSCGDVEEVGGGGWGCRTERVALGWLVGVGGLGGGVGRRGYGGERWVGCAWVGGELRWMNGG